MLAVSVIRKSKPLPIYLENTSSLTVTNTLFLRKKNYAVAGILLLLESEKALQKNTYKPSVEWIWPLLGIRVKCEYV